MNYLKYIIKYLNIAKHFLSNNHLPEQFYVATATGLNYKSINFIENML